MKLVPLHAEPAGHSVQLVRSVCEPPLVNEPGPQISQCSALFSLNMLSAPHGAHPTLSSRYVPARQNLHCVAPALDVAPVGQAVQLGAPGSEE